MAVNKTLYVRDEDAPVWEKARELAGEKLSSFLTSYLRDFVQREEARASGFGRILLNFREDCGLPRAVAFNGRWLIQPEQPLRVPGDGNYAVATTAKNSVVVFRFNGTADDDGFFPWGDFMVFESWEQAVASAPGDVIAVAMKRMGVRVQELDI